MQEEWTRWEPISGLASRYDIDSILESNDDRGLIITLYSCQDKNKKIEVIFDRYVDSYRHTNESFIISLPYDLTEKYGRDFYGDWNFFKITHSEYLTWLAYASCDYSKGFDFTHFCLLCPNSVVDIVARYEPIVRHLP